MSCQELSAPKSKKHLHVCVLTHNTHSCIFTFTCTDTHSEKQTLTCLYGTMWCWREVLIFSFCSDNWAGSFRQVTVVLLYSPSESFSTQVQTLPQLPQHLSLHKGRNASVKSIISGTLMQIRNRNVRLLSSMSDLAMRDVKSEYTKGRFCVHVLCSYLLNTYYFTLYSESMLWKILIACS